MNYATSGATAIEGQDYTEASGTLRFPARTTAAQTIAVTVNDDSTDEDTEMFTVTLSNAANAQLAGAERRCRRSDASRMRMRCPDLRIGAASLSEGAGGGGMRFEVRLAPASGRTVTVQYGTADVTATRGNDYTAASGTLTFRAGTTVLTVAVPITATHWTSRRNSLR